MPWQPGQSGNPTGIVKEKTFRAALDRAIAQDNGKRLRQTMEKLLDMGARGESWAVNIIADRLDGKAAQQLIHSNDPDNPLFTDVARKVVDPTP
jgi:hypothetical protein